MADDIAGEPVTGRDDRAEAGLVEPIADGPALAIHTSSFESFCDAKHAELAAALALALGHQELGRDAAAEALTRAWERWSTVSGYDNPAGWVYRVGLNWGRSRLRRRRREVTSAYVPDTRVEPTEYDDRLRLALAHLTDDHRAVIVAKYYLDWSEADIADALDIPPGTVKSRLSRAIGHLHDRMDTNS